MLRRQVLILSHLPDPVAAIGLDGEIKFCNVQMLRILRYSFDDLIGANIDDISVPSSRGAMRRLIQDMVTLANHLEAGRGGGNGSDGNGGPNYSGDSSNDDNMISRSSDQSFPLLEVNVDQDEVGSGENVSDSSGNPRSQEKDSKKDSKHSTSSVDKSKSQSTVSTLTQKSSSLTTETSTVEDSDEHTKKKSRMERNSNAHSVAKDNKRSSSGGRNVDNVMGSPVTANNADAKLSSLLHNPNADIKDGIGDRKSPPEEMLQQQEKKKPGIHRKTMMAPADSSTSLTQKQESSSTSSDSPSDQRAGVNNSSEDSGHRGSNESSDSYEDSSSTSGTVTTPSKKG